MYYSRSNGLNIKHYDQTLLSPRFALSLAKQTATLLAVWEEEDDLALEFSSITGLMKTSFTSPSSLSKVAVHFLKANNWDVSKNMDKFQTTLNLAYSVYVLQKQMEWRMKVGKKGNNKGGVSLEDFVIGTAEDRMESQTKGVERKVSNKEGKGSLKNRDSVKKDSVKATPEKKGSVKATPSEHLSEKVEKSQKLDKAKQLAALALAKKLKKAKGGSAKKVKK
jgi:hypothetical protein